MTHFTEIQDENVYCITHTYTHTLTHRHETSTSKLPFPKTTVVRL